MTVTSAEPKTARPGRGRLIMGVVGVLGALVYLNEIRGMRLGTVAEPGPALFPLLLGATFATISLAVVCAELVSPRDRTPDVSPPQGGTPPEDATDRSEPVGGTRERWRDKRELLLLIGLFVAYAILLPHLGHFVATLLFCLVFLRTVGRLSWIRVAVWSIVFSVSVHVLFVGVLGVRLPIGLISI
ncbi:tripartite tricarboxylate transporter TctB family protein [Spiractinospora alimapuensis]|uniref:tripartite tricarboxylate transporter TctB family protein n=1 Tax=Spiractinospora alimapuensis TaxID=2820884 RepID=UPI001F479095|nr:tripartite tricarboxylate transporter TctB family protein [Spiractinospora alimapuensis]QVQ52275.1 tripartite tricarboxylate transporter TctB family protein [Spiractinospora alimapuensis]